MLVTVKWVVEDGVWVSEDCAEAEFARATKPRVMNELKNFILLIDIVATLYIDGNIDLDRIDFFFFQLFE